MANISRIANWAIKNKQALELEVTRITWTDDWLPNFFDYRVKLKMFGKNYIGRGLAESESNAFDKGISEAIERAVAATYVPNLLVGVAAHENFEKAKYRAYFEALEFDRVFCHHYTRLPGVKVSWDLLKNGFPILSVLNKLKELNLEFQLYEMRPTIDAKVYAAFIWCSDIDILNKPRGFVAGFGCDSTPYSAALHAALECLREAVAVFVGNKKLETSLHTLESAGDPVWHFWKAQDKKSLDFLHSNFFEGSRGSLKNDPLNEEFIKIDDFKFAELAEFENNFQNVPIAFAAISANNKLAIPQFGRFAILDENLVRLSTFSSKKVNFDGTQPHFYG